MKATIIFSDSDYQKILSMTRRVDGTIGMISPGEFDFRAFNRSGNGRGEMGKLMRTRHGMTRITEEKIRTTITINRTAEKVDPVEVIYDESDEAADFVQTIMKG